MGKGILKGLTIKISGDTVNLVKELDKAEQESKRLGNTVDSLRKKLVLKWDSNTFKRAQETAQKAVDQTSERVENLKAALAEVEKTDTGKTQKQITELKKQIEKAEEAAEQAKKRLNDLGTVKLDHLINQANELGDKLVSSGAKLTAGLTTPIALAGKAAVDAASDLAESQNVIDVAFGYSASEINKWSQNLIDDFGMSELSAKTYAGTFKTLSNSMGVADESGKEMAMTLTELSSDMASFYNAEQDVAANALKGIFTGETESLKQFGVVMTDTTLSAYALSKGITTTYSSMSQSEKVMLRYQYVTEALSQAQGDFANTSDSLANQQRKLQAQLQTTAAELGAELLPIVEDVMEEVIKIVREFDNWSDGSKKTVVQVLALVAAIGPLMTAFGGINKLVGAGAGLFKTLSTAIGAARAAYANGTGVVSAFTSALNLNAAAQAAVTAGASLLVGVLANLIINFVQAEKSLENCEGALENLNRRMEDIAQNGFASASEELAKLDNVVDNIIPRIEALANKTELTKEETDELQALIPLLNDQLGYEAASFDAATGAINMNTSAIMQNIQAMRQRAVANAASLEYQDLANQLYEGKKDRQNLMAQLDENTKAYNEQVRLMGEASLGTITEREDIKSMLAQQAEYEAALKKSMDTIAQEYMYFGETATSELNKVTAAEQAATGATVATQAERKAAFDAELQELQYQRQLGTVQEETYRSALMDINNKYNYDNKELWRQYYAECWEITNNGEKNLTQAVKSGGSSRSSATRSATSEQTAIVKQAYEQQVAAAKQAYEQQKALLKSNYDAAIKQIDAELKAKEKAINAEIAAINKQIEARRRQKQEDSYDSQINSLQASIDYGMGKFDEFTLRQLKQQLDDVEEERADYRWELEQQDRIDALEEELANARELAEAQKEMLQEMYEMHLEMLEEEYQLHLEQLDEIFKTADDEFKGISSAFVAAMQSGASAAAATLMAAVNAANGAASKLATLQSNSKGKTTAMTTDNRAYSMTLNNAGYTDAQAARVFKMMMYE